MCVVYVTRVVEAVRRQVHVVCVTRVVEAVGQGLCGPRNRSSSAKLCKRLSAHLFILLKQGETKSISSEVEDVVESHVCNLCVILRSCVLWVVYNLSLIHI